MKSTIKWLGIVAIAAVIGMTVAGCVDAPQDNGDDSSGLPPAIGVNAVSGKTYYSGDFDRTVFSETADGAANGTYVVTMVDSGTYAPGVKYTYTTQKQTGIYSWNEEAKTVTLKLEMTIFYVPTGLINDNGYGTITVEHTPEPLNDKTGYRSKAQADVEYYRNEIGQAAFNQWLSSMGFSSAAAYIDYEVNEKFGNKTRGYSFSADGTAVFLEEVLPANRGKNEFNGQTYYGLIWGAKYNDIKFVFTASGYTLTGFYDGTVTGSYAYDSNTKMIWLRPEKFDGEDRAAIYAAETAYPGHHYPDDNAYRAVQTNELFNFWPVKYYSTDKTIVIEVPQW